MSNTFKGMGLGLSDSLVEASRKIAESSAEYKTFFDGALKKFGVTSPQELESGKKKEFYDYIDANWNSDDEDGKDGKKDKPKTDTDEGLNASYGKDKKDLKASACKSEEHEDDEDEDEDEDEVKEEVPESLKNQIKQAQANLERARKFKSQGYQRGDGKSSQKRAQQKVWDAEDKLEALRDKAEGLREKEQTESVELDANLLERVLNELG